MYPRRKSKSRPADQDIFVEVMEPRVLLSADALGVDSSVFDRDSQAPPDWDLSAATNWWSDSKHALPSDLSDPVAENFSPSAFHSFNSQELINDGVSPVRDSLDAMSLSSSIDVKQALYREIVFLDAGVVDGEQLLSDLLRNTNTATTQVYLIDSTTDGVEQISAALNNHHALDAVHIISHGTTSQVQLGSGTLSSSNIESYSDQLNAWGSALHGSGDILIYGCDVASSAQGQALLDVMSTLTRADIAASVDPTGNTEQGIDWGLEYQTGIVEATAFTSSGIQVWSGVLATNNNPSFSSSGPFTVDEGALATTVVGNIDADDGDGGATDAGITYSITSNVNPDADGNDAFVIDSSTGKITVNDAGDLDFEETTPLTITVQFDDGAQTSTIDVTVNLNDVAPTLAAAGAATITAGQAYALDLTATEPGISGITDYTVNWGDGHVTTEAYTGPTTSVSHVYDNAGFTYHISFAANDVSDVWSNSDLIVASWDVGHDDVFVFDGVSGDAGGQFDPSSDDLDRPYGIAVGPDGNFYVAGFDSNNIVSYAADGSYLGVFSAHGQLNNPSGLAWGGDGNLYVANYGGNNILRIDAGGTFIDIWGAGGTLNGPEALAFSPDGDLYVSSSGNNQVVMFDGTLGGVATTVVDTGVNNPEQIVFDEAGNLYVANTSGDEVLRWDGATLSRYFTHTDLSYASGLVFGPDGQLYVSSFNNDTILRYDGVTGEVFVNDGTGGLDKPTFLAFTPDHQVTIEPNNAPAATSLISASSYSEGDASVALTDIVVSDVDAAEVITATLTLANTTTGSLAVTDGATYTAGTGVWTITDSVENVNTALANVMFNPTASNVLDTTINVNIDDGDEDASGSLMGTITLEVTPNIDGAVSTNVPGSQSTDEDSALVFSTGGGNAITVDDGTAGDSILRTSLTVTNGVLKLSTVAGLSFDNGADDTSSMTITGLESAINTALNGLTFTPTLDYEGLASLQIGTDLQADLQGFYTFTQTGALGEDSSPDGANAGVPSNSGTAPIPSAVFDSNRGSDVLVLDGVDDNIQIAGLFSTPNDITLAAWVNVSSAINQDAISIGDSVSLRVNSVVFGTGVTGLFYDGSTWKQTTSGDFIGNDGWHHVAFTFDDTSNTQVVYIDGIAADSTNHTESINWTLEDNTTIGSHAGGSIFFLDGMVDDVRVYDRALSSGQIAAIANDSVSETSAVSIIIEPINDAPSATNLTSNSAYIEGDASVPITDIVLSDVDVGEAISASLTLSNTAAGSLSANDGATYTVGTGIWTITDSVGNVNTALANVVFSPVSNNDLDTTIGIVIDDGDEDASSALNGVISLDVTPQNDEQVLENNTGVTVDEGSVGTVIDNTQLKTTDVDNTAGQLVYSVSDPTVNGTLRLSGTVLNQGDTFTQDDIDNSRITYDHDGSETTADSFGFSVVDIVSVASTDTFNITVTAQNDEQRIISNISTTVNEGSTGSVINTAMLETTDVDNAATELVYTLTLQPDHGTLKLGGNEVVLNDTFTQADIDNDELTYDHSGSETPDDSFGFRVDDGAGSSSTGTFAFDISLQNDEQIIALNSGATVNEGSVDNAIDSTLLRTIDTDHSATNLVYSVTAETSHGALKLGGTELSLSDTFTQGQINSGEMTYDHDGSETINDSFGFSVDDGEGSASFGTFSFAITPQNDEQQLIINSGATVDAGSSGSAISGAMLATTDVDNIATEVVYKVVAIPSNGTLKLNGITLVLHDSFTQDDIDNSRITYDHDGSVTISDSFDFSVDDGVGSQSTGTFNLKVEQEPTVPEVIVPVGNKASIEEISSNVQLASQAEAVQNANATAEEPEVESESKSDAEISIDEEQAGEFEIATDIQYQFTTPSGIAGSNAAASSSQGTLIARLLQTPAIAGLLSAPYEFDALSLEINRVLTSYEFTESMDSLRKDLDDKKVLRGAVVGSSVAVTTGFSVGYVAWMVRGGVLLSSVLSSLPAWQFIDPLPVLNFSEKEEENAEQDDSLEDIITDHGKTPDVTPVSDRHDKSTIPTDSKETRQ